jgi:hypothetical protein
MPRSIFPKSPSHTDPLNAAAVPSTVEVSPHAWSPPRLTNANAMNAALM